MTDPFDGLDAPRPLAPDLRTRLEDALLGSDARPLSDDQSRAIGEALSDPVGDLLHGLDAPRALPVALRSGLESSLVRRSRRWPAAVAASVAAAAALVVGVVALPDRTDPPSVTAGPRQASPTVTRSVAPGPSPLPLDRADAGAGSTGGTTGSATAGRGGTPGLVPAPAAPAAVSGPAPDSLSPSSGQAGDWVTITGVRLGGVTDVRFDGARSPEVRAVSDTELRARAPQHAPGEVAVVVAGASGSLRFTYLAR